MNNTHVLRNTIFCELDNLTAPETTRYDILIPDLEASYAADYPTDMAIPLYVLKDNSPLESIVVYLKDVKGLKYAQIARLLSRDQRTVWVTYSNAKKKGVRIKEEDSDIFLPLDIFRSRKLSVLEAVVFYLKNLRNLSFNQIAQSIGKDYRTVWTVYRRAMKKL